MLLKQLIKGDIVLTRQGVIGRVVEIHEDGHVYVKSYRGDVRQWHVRSLSFCPTPTEIEKRCRRIREKWTDDQLRARLTSDSAIPTDFAQIYKFEIERDYDAI